MALVLLLRLFYYPNMIKTFSIVVLLITLFNFGSFAEEIQAFNFTKEEFDNLTVRKIKKKTKYTLGSNEMVIF